MATVAMARVVVTVVNYVHLMFEQRQHILTLAKSFLETRPSSVGPVQKLHVLTVVHVVYEVSATNKVLSIAECG